MKTNVLLLLSAIVALTVLRPRASLAGPHAFAVGGRYHADHSEFDALPFGDDDISYGVAYEYHDTMAFWQLAATYTPDPTGTNTADYVITPQISLIAKDRIWRGGIGLLKSYVEDKDGDNHWTDLYYQFMLGVSVPIARIELNAMAYYAFEDWGDLSDFEFGDVEYGLWLKLPF